MVSTVCVPRLNANEDELLIADVLVSPGDRVTRGTELFVVESTKATESVYAETDGFVRKVLVASGNAIPVGSPVCVLSESLEEPLGDEKFGGDDSAIDAESADRKSRTTAKERLQAKREAKRRSASGAGIARKAAKHEPVASADLDWLQAIRAVTDQRCGADLGLPEREYDANTVEPLASEGVFIEEGASLGEGARITARRLYIGRNAHVGKGTTLKADTIYLGREVRIWDDVSMVSGQILIDDGAAVVSGTTADLSGGRHADSGLLVGAASLIASNVYLNTCREILIERECAISPGAMLFTHSFWQSVLEGYSATFNGIRICENSWVGAGCQILPGVVVGSGSIAISNSTVTNNVPPDSVVGGVPAQILRSHVRKALAAPDRLMILKSLLIDFTDNLRFKKCQVAVSNDNDAITVSRPDIPTRSIVIANGDGVPQVEDAHRAIYVALGTRCDFVETNSVFDLDKRHFSGVEDRLTHELRNFLRRRGIRLTPDAWDTDHRNGL